MLSPSSSSSGPIFEPFDDFEESRNGIAVRPEDRKRAQSMPPTPELPNGNCVVAVAELWRAQLLRHREELHSFLNRWLDEDQSMYHSALGSEKDFQAMHMSLDTIPGHEEGFELSFDEREDGLPKMPSAPGWQPDLAASHEQFLEENASASEKQAGSLDKRSSEKPAGPLTSLTSQGSQKTTRTVTFELSHRKPSVASEHASEQQDSKPLRSSLYHRTERSLAARQMREEFKAFMMAAEGPIAVTEWQGPVPVIQLATSQWFLNFGMLAIASNAVYMIWGESIPLENRSHYRRSLLIGDIVFLSFFGVELAVQWVARGLRRFFTTEGWQLRCVELLVVTEQAFSLVVDSADSNFVRATRLLRAARFSRILRVVRFVRLLQLLLASSQYRLMGKSIQIMPQTVAIAGCILYFTVQVFALMISMQVRVFLDEKVDAGQYEFLLLHFGSVMPSVASLWSAMTLGTSWQQIADELLKVGDFCFIIFQIYVFVFMFIVTNLIRSLFIQNTMQTMNISKTFDIRNLMNKKHVFVSDLKEAFGSDALEYEDISGQCEATRASVAAGALLEGPKQLALNRFLTVTQLATTDLDNIMYCLSDAGTQIVSIEEFVTSCIGQMFAPTKADLQSLSIRQMQLHAAFQRAKLADGADVGGRDSLSTTTDRKELRIIVTSVAELTDEVTAMYDSRFVFDDAGIQNFLNTLRCTIEAAKQAKGGTGFIIGTVAAYKKLKQRRIRMEPTDVSADYQKGYMTCLLEHHHVGDDEFLQAIRDFSDHSLEEGDRWPAGHPAAGSPKDGYMLLSHTGTCRMGAAKLSGCPKSRCVWRGVGTRHQTGLAVCEVLAGELAAVVIVSDSKKITVLCPFGVPLGVQTGKPPSNQGMLTASSSGSTLGGIIHGWSQKSGWYSVDGDKY